ncbi:MAG: NAD(P)-binding domain-containing protein, partial [Bacteroidetes bacterium]|nr:NAD(P)-binding domain-containing protein [Bacteroidota bacterium]
MKVAIIGYGKMGKEIEQILHQRGHECVLRITSSNLEDLEKTKQLGVEIAIEFSHPGAVLGNLK